MSMKYCLANYILSIQPNDNALKAMFSNVSVGGEGSAHDSINVSLDKTLWDVEGFATGAYTFNKNLSRTGSITVNISQLSDKVAKFKQMCNIFYNGEYNGFTLSVIDNLGNKVCTAIDCYLEKIPGQEFSETATKQQWKFVCGEITFD